MYNHELSGESLRQVALLQCYFISRVGGGLMISWHRVGLVQCSFHCKLSSCSFCGTLYCKQTTQNLCTHNVEYKVVVCLSTFNASLADLLVASECQIQL